MQASLPFFTKGLNDEPFLCLPVFGSKYIDQWATALLLNPKIH